MTGKQTLVIAGCVAVVLLGLLGLANHTRAANALMPNPDFQDLAGYQAALDRSTDPQAIALRRRIADGPAALAHERAAALQAGIPDGPQVPDIPDEKNGAALLEQWNVLLMQTRAELPGYADSLTNDFAYTPDQIARAQKVFDDNPQVFALLRQAADRPYRVFPDEPWKHMGNIREAARELRTDGYLLAHRGRYADAVDAGARGLHFAKQDAPQAGLVGYLVDQALERIALAGLRDTLATAGPNAAVDAHAGQAVRAALPVLSLPAALRQEAAKGLGEMDRYRRFPPADLAVMALDNRAPGGGAPAPPVRERAFTPDERRFLNDLVDAAQARYLSEMSGLIRAVEQSPEARRAAFAALEQMAAGTSAGPDAARDPIRALDPLYPALTILRPAFGTLGLVDDQAQAEENVTLAAAASLEAKALDGAFPAAPPGGFLDPFSGKPLGYRREGPGGFVVYSVGPSGKFDGAPTPDPRRAIFFRYPPPAPHPLPAARGR